MQGDMHTSGVLRPGVYQSQGPQCACVSQQLERAPESLFLESYPMSIAQFQQPGYVQSGSGNQRQDVPIVTDTFQGNMQQQTQFSSGSDRVSAQAATRQKPVKNTDEFTQRYPVSGPLQTSSADQDHRPAMFSAPHWKL